jgi:hypothetical protein
MTTTVRARVRNGRLVLDEPTDLPEGSEVELVAAEPADADWNLTYDEVAQLQESLAQAARGETVPADVVLRDLKERAELDRRLDEHRAAPVASEWSAVKARILAK